MAGMAQSFAEALRRSEETRDPEPLVRLFAEGCELRNLALAGKGLEGARRSGAPISTGSTASAPTSPT